VVPCFSICFQNTHLEEREGGGLSQNDGVATIVPIDDPTDERVSDFTALSDPDRRRRVERPGPGDDGFFVVEGPLVVRRLVRSDYRLRAPDRLRYVTNGHTEAVVIARTRWFRAADIAWQREPYGSGIAFSTRSWFRWSSYATSVRLLRQWPRNGRRYAELALMDPGTPVWTRLTLALDDMRVLREQQTTGGHFTTNTYTRFDRPDRIEPPRLRP